MTPKAPAMPPPPPPPPPLPPAAAPATMASSQVQAAGGASRTRAAVATQSGTVGMAGIRGLAQPLSTARATLLGGTSR